MIVLGLDPGSTRIGYGIIEKNRGALSLIAYGTLECNRGVAPGQLVYDAATRTAAILKRYTPQIVGIEKLYFAKNTKTALEVAQTRGVLLLEVARLKIPTYEFSPSEVKRAVAQYGLADKKAVAKMVAHILNAPPLHGFDDASDALAIAITATLVPPTHSIIDK